MWNHHRLICMYQVGFIFQLAGVVAVEVTGGPTIDFIPGRKVYTIYAEVLFSLIIHARVSICIAIFYSFSFVRILWNLHQKIAFQMPNKVINKIMLGSLR